MDILNFVYSELSLHTWNLLPSDISSCHTVHTSEDVLKHACLDSLNLKLPAPLYPILDFKGLYNYWIIIKLYY